MKTPKYLTIAELKSPIRDRRDRPRDVDLDTAETDAEIYDIYSVLNNTGRLCNFQVLEIGKFYKSHADMITMDFKNKEKKERETYEKLKEKFDGKK